MLDLIRRKHAGLNLFIHTYRSYEIHTYISGISLNILEVCEREGIYRIPRVGINK